MEPGFAHLPYDDLQLGEQIGGGGWSVVQRARWHGTPVAVKRHFSPAGGVLEEEALQEFMSEALTMQGLRHPHVVQCLGACLRPPNVCLVTELLPHSLHSVLYAQPAIALDRKRVLALATDVSRAFVYLHHVASPPVIHHDLKPSNLLLDRSWRVKVADFGLAGSKRAAAAGTPAYMAPEKLLPGPFSSKVDVYAFGVLLNELLLRCPPWAGVPPAEIKRQVLAGKRPMLCATCPKAVQGLLVACWAQEAAARPDFRAVLAQLEELAVAEGG